MVYNKDGNKLIGNNLPLFDEFTRTNLIKHRGGNSASDLATAYNNGYRAVEGDVRFTSDSVPIMCHDATLGGLTIASSTLAQLEAVATVYTLDDWFTDCRKYNILAEIDFTKTYTASECALLVQHIHDKGMEGRCTIECYPTTSALDLINNSEDLILSLLSTSSTSGIDAVADISNKCRKVICVIAHDYASDSLISYAHKKGYLVRVWTGTGLDTVADVDGYLDMGADFVITDNCKPSDIVPT